MIAIAATEARDAIKEPKDLEDRIRQAMRATVDHWMCTNEQDRFAAALAAALELTTDPDEKERFEATLELLRTLSAATSGISVNMDPALERIERTPGGAVQVAKIWQEIKKEVLG